MSVKNGILTILSAGPAHGYLLRQEFEARTGGTWPINISQVYSTLQRLERDGLVSSDTRSDPVNYTITTAGHHTVQEWWYSPTLRAAPERGEVAIKVALAVTTPGIDIQKVITAQRIETMRALRDFTLLKANLPTEPPTAAPEVTSVQNTAQNNAWELVLDSYIFTLEAEARWLDHIETRASQLQAQAPLGARQTTPKSASQSAAPAPAPATGTQK